MSLPSDFNYKDYLSLNPDLNKSASKSEIENHYLTYGRNEGREYSYKSRVKLLVVIMTCKKHWDLWAKLRHKTDNCILFTGCVENYYSEEDKVLYLKVNDNYEGLPEKVIMMIEINY
jgi:hypothetical protein